MCKFRVNNRVEIVSDLCNNANVGDKGVVVGLSNSQNGCYIVKLFTGIAKGNEYPFTTRELKLTSNDIENVQEGDILIDTRYDKRLEVLGICGKIIHLSYADNCDSYNRSSTIKDLKQDGYEIEIPEPEEETVTITINGKDTIISKKSAEALNLI